MKTAYIDYSMSVIVSRAIPDVRDGLKPVHRRVLYAMADLGLYHNRPYKKSARIVGEVLGKYHPHGDASVYDTMVRMAQPWSLRYPLVNGQGNFGSIDGDSPAAMRYTEARLKKLAEEMLQDIDKETVDFDLNFDDSLQEPTVLPSRFPNLLCNGANGIAVGMATTILPHNLSEVVDAMCAYVDNKDITIEGLMEYIKAPDFPTGGIIYGYEGVKQAFETGRGKIIVRGKAEIEPSEHGKNDKIVITEIPYLVNKANLIMKAADLVNDKRLEGISDIRDESDRDGMRIVFELKRDAIPNVVLNHLYKYTPLQTSFGVNNIALVKGRPKLLNLKDLISNFVDFRHEVVVRRTQYELRKAEERAHILEGYLIALDNLDEIITLIRSSKTPDEARDGLVAQFSLSEIQAKAILEMRLQRLTGMERDKIRKEYEEIKEKVAWYKKILADESIRMGIIKDELQDLKKEYGDERRTSIDYYGGEFSIEDMIPKEDVVITISHLGYIKRTQANEFRKQNRGGRGSRGSQTRTEDFIEHLFVASTHDYLLLFTDRGQCYWLRVYELPEGTKTSKGRAIQNMINLPPGDQVRAYLKVDNLSDEDYVKHNFIVFCTRKGIIKKTVLEAFSRPRQNGIRALTFKEDDALLEVRMTNGHCYIMIAKKSGRAIRFHESNVRPMGRTAAGVRGITLEGKDDKVIGMVCVQEGDENQSILVVSERGYGKRSLIDDYRITNRGGKGVKTINITPKTGSLIAIKNVRDEDDLMIITRSGVAIRMGLDDIRIMGRATQGVRLIKINEKDKIADVAKIENMNNENGEEPEGETPGNN